MVGLSPELLELARSLVHEHDDWAAPAVGIFQGRSVWRQQCRLCAAIPTSAPALDAMAAAMVLQGPQGRPTGVN